MLKKKNNKLLSCGSALRTNCCERDITIDPPWPPPGGGWPPFPPFPFPPMPGPTMSFGDGCCLPNASSTSVPGVPDTNFFGCHGKSGNGVVIFFGNASYSCNGFFAAYPQDKLCGNISSDAPAQEAIVADIAVGQRIEAIRGTAGGTPEVELSCGGGGSHQHHVFSFYNMFSNCQGDPTEVDDNARTPLHTRAFYLLAGMAGVNGTTIRPGQWRSMHGQHFNPNRGVQREYTGGTSHTIKPIAHSYMVPTFAGELVEVVSAWCIVRVFFGMRWFHKDDYDLYARFVCDSSEDRGWQIRGTV